ncbi:hypothetical protein NUITMVRA1_10530 [Aerococcus viridans]|nr:hypothetical protein NUITMVRA1_10530 [Aerococcus viridans]
MIGIKAKGEIGTWQLSHLERPWMKDCPRTVLEPTTIKNEARLAKRTKRMV